MRKTKKMSMASLALFGSLFLFSTAAFALHPDLVIPEKVEVKHRACQEIMRLGSKYKVEGLFSKEFEAGTSATPGWTSRRPWLF